ncbi:hypothetical protein LZC95_39925 [Pendulispora brunnea]|uniref:Uncharacterized protein n=1 Tax=Pendulispora brunnea TaxID=2905690 RepID=A0ABZ2K5G6_9BACT
MTAKYGLWTAMVVASFGAGAGLSLLHCSGANADIPGDVPDASLQADGSEPRTCTACGENQVCSNGQCTDLPAQCPCPLGSYCDLGANRCVRGCIGESHCSDGEYCDVEKRTCNLGCDKDQECKTGEFCKRDVHVCAPGCRTDDECVKPAICQPQSGNRVCAVPWRAISGTPAHVESVTMGASCLYALTSEEAKRPLGYAISAYCPSSKAWTINRLSVPNAGRAVPQIASLGSRVYIAGGIVETDAGVPEPTTRTTFWNGTDTSGTQSAPLMNVARRTHAMASDGSLVYAFDHGTMEVLSASASEWALRKFSTLDLAHPGFASAGDSLYVTGGLDARGAPTGQVWKLTANGNANLLGTLAKPRGRHATVAKPDGTLYVFGGDATRRSVEVFPGGRELTPLPNSGNVIGAVLTKNAYFYVVTDAGEMFTNEP